MSTTAESPGIVTPETAFEAEAADPPVAAPAATGTPLIDRDALKSLMKEAMVEVLHEHRALIGAFLLEAWEDRALGDAIQEGRESGLASEDEVFAILDQFR